MQKFQSLSFETNTYESIVVDPGSLPCDAAEFSCLLPQAIDLWRSDNLRSVWLKIPIEKSVLVSVAVANGFEFHSTDPDALMLTLRIEEDVDLPGGPTHQIGAGGVVVNKNDELLVVVERAHAKTRPNYFKLPGGRVDSNERLSVAVEREVWEETGIKARFEAVATFRHWLDFRPNMSDIYFVCRLTPLTHEITPQLSEIDRALWMPVNDYLNHPDVSVFNKRVVELAHKDDGLRSGSFKGYEMAKKTREIFFQK